VSASSLPTKVIIVALVITAMKPRRKSRQVVSQITRLSKKQHQQQKPLDA
jgi:hypothetical protein